MGEFNDGDEDAPKRDMTITELADRLVKAEGNLTGAREEMDNAQMHLDSARDRLAKAEAMVGQCEANRHNLYIGLGDAMGFDTPAGRPARGMKMNSEVAYEVDRAGRLSEGRR